MIINADEVKQVYVANHYVDMRKSIDGLTMIVTQVYGLNVLDHSLFIFTNKSRNRLKILYYENNGFWLFFKRLEHGKFKINVDDKTHTKTISSTQLNWLLEGLEYDGLNSKKRLLI